MFKSLTKIFQKKAVAVIPVTPDLVCKRRALCTNLEHLYETQIALLSKTSVKASTIPLVKHYLELLPQYQTQLEQLKSNDYTKDDFPEETFLEVINKQLEMKVSELESINLKITPSDLKNLDENYSAKLDQFFYHFHTNRISASYALKEYVYPEPLLQEYNSRAVVERAIKTTSQMLSLNDYPVPKFELVGSEVAESPKIYCVSPHIVHIMFELFKNATIPSLTHSTPICIEVYADREDPNMITYEIKDHAGGMPASMVKKIWQFHYTTSKANDRDPIHGFGMGLPLCKVFAEFNDGSLELLNKEGDGVTVYLKIPRGI